MSRVFSLVVVFAALLVLASAQSSSSTGGAAGVTFCSNYTTILYGINNSTNQIALLTAIVTRAAIGNQTATTPAVQGLFSPAGPLYNIFSGAVQYRVGAPNYTALAAPTTTLVSHLVGYFGAAFGCNAGGFTPVNNPDMYAVHQNMSINSAMETYFNQQLANTLLSFGVDGAVLNAQAAPFLQLFYQCAPPIATISSTARVQICGASDCGYGSYSQAQATSNCNLYYASSSSSTGTTNNTGTGAAAAQYGASAFAVIGLAALSALVL